ncbi:MAG: hypothetical protein KDD22_01790 [Bdellovibrionales bacterium]|nr:hypothetical protein [Bdellovibrionales bacterium]
MIFEILLSIGMACSVANAGEMIKIPTDPNATYEVLEKGGSKQKPTLKTKRVGSSGASYAIRIFDCAAQTSKYLADGSTLEALAKSKPSKSMSPIMKDSIAWYQYKYVCK